MSMTPAEIAKAGQDSIRQIHQLSLKQSLQTAIEKRLRRLREHAPDRAKADLLDVITAFNAALSELSKENLVLRVSEEKKKIWVKEDTEVLSFFMVRFPDKPGAPEGKNLGLWGRFLINNGTYPILACGFDFRTVGPEQATPLGDRYTLEAVFEAALSEATNLAVILKDFPEKH